MLYHLPKNEESAALTILSSLDDLVMVANTCRTQSSNQESKNKLSDDMYQCLTCSWPLISPRTENRVYNVVTCF